MTYCTNNSVKNTYFNLGVFPFSFFFIDYKNVNLLRRYIGITGKILPRRVTKLTASEHRRVAKAIRQARRVGLLPFVWLTS
jgi:small subunit ribosomal protein S18